MSQSTEERIQQELATERLERALYAAREVLGLPDPRTMPKSISGRSTYAEVTPEEATILAALITAYKE